MLGVVSIIAAVYMSCVLPVAVIVLLLLMICIRAHFIRRIESFGVNAGYYLAGDGSWAGQMAAASAAADGSTGLVPAPLVGQQNSYLRGDGKWIQANNAPSTIAYMLVFRTLAANIDKGAAVTFQKVVNSSGNLISLSGDGAKFTLVPGYTYKLTSCNNFSSWVGSGSNPYQWYNNTTAQFIGITGNFQAIPSGPYNQGPAVAFISPASITTVSIYGVMPTDFNNIGSAADAPGTGGSAGYLLGFWASVEAISNTTVAAFGGATATAPGAIGYIPAPLAGQQNYVLTGSGTWQLPPKQQYLLAVGSENQLWRKNYMASVWVGFGQCCVTSFCQLRDGSFLGVGVDNALYTLANLNAKWIYGGDNTKAVKHVTQLSDATLLGVGMDNQLYTKTTLTAPWINIPGSGTVTSVIQLQDGRIVGIGTDNAMYIKTSLTAAWTYGGDNTKAVSCVTQLQDGSLVGIGLDFKLYSRAHMQANWVYGGDNTCCVKCIVAILL